MFNLLCTEDTAATSSRLLPGSFMGRQMSDLFLCGGPSLVLARRHIQSAWVPLVVHIFPPLITYSSPFLTALVMMPVATREVWGENVRLELACQSGAITHTHTQPPSPETTKIAGLLHTYVEILFFSLQ